ncbi:MAG: hypothetical protein IJ383_00190 [Bacteroidales bacterium]|nr:hypothetical protein [Bacteroidales bacterium]
MILAASCEKSEPDNGIPDDPSENTLSLKKTSASLEYLQVMTLGDIAPAGAVWSVVEGKDVIVSVFNDTLVARGKGTAKLMAQLGEEKGVMTVTVNSDEYIPVRTLKLQVNGKQVVTLSVDSMRNIVYNDDVVNTFEVFQHEAVKEVKVVGYEPANATCPAIEKVYYYDVDGAIDEGDPEGCWRYQQGGDTCTGEMKHYLYTMEGSLSDLSGKIGSGGTVKFANWVEGKFWNGYEAAGLGFKMQILPDVLLVGDRKNGKERALEYELTNAAMGDRLFKPSNGGGSGWQSCQGRLKWLWFERPNSVEVVTNNEYQEYGWTNENIVIRPGETIQLQFKAQAPVEFIETAEWGLENNIVFTGTGFECTDDCADDEFQKAFDEGSLRVYAKRFLTLTRDGKLTCSPDIDLNYYDPKYPNERIQDDDMLMPVTVFLMPSCKKGPYERVFEKVYVWASGYNDVWRETGPSTLKAVAHIQIIPW